MKTISLTFIVCLLTSTLLAQNIISRFYFSKEYKDKWELYKMSQNGPNVVVAPINISFAILSEEYRIWLTKTYIIGYHVTDRFSAEFGYSWENYNGAFHYYSSEFNYLHDDGGITLTVENARNHLFRLNYAFFNKKRIKFIGSAAYVFSKSRAYYGFPFKFNSIDASRSPINPNRYLYQKASERDNIDTGLRKYFNSLDARLLLEYAPFKWGSIYVGGGYTHGFNTFAHFNVTYWIDNEPKNQSISDIKGSNYYYCFGVKLNPFVFIKKKTKKIKKNLTN